MKKISKHRMVMKKQVEQVFYERDICRESIHCRTLVYIPDKGDILYMCGACVYENVCLHVCVLMTLEYVALLEHSMLHGRIV